MRDRPVTAWRAQQPGRYASRIRRADDKRAVGESPRLHLSVTNRLGATPDPIPNSAVKPRPPMILARGKVGHRRRFGLKKVTLW